MKKHTYKSNRSRRDAKFIKFVMTLSVAILIFVLVLCFTTIQLDNNSTNRPTSNGTSNGTKSSRIIGRTVHAYEPQPVSTPVEVQLEIETAESEMAEWYIELTEDEKYILATLIYLEGRGESLECQYAIGSVVLNRMTTSGSDLESVIYAKGQFQPAYLISSTDPTGTQLEIVNQLCISGPTLPEYVTYFRAEYYHEWGDLNPYTCIDNTYFSYSGDVCRQVMSAVAEEE